MQRREFVTSSVILVIGIGVFGNITWNGSKFIGDTPTTTDILGPFYREAPSDKKMPDVTSGMFDV